MDKVLVEKDRLKKIAKFIDLGDDCYGCPLYGKCHWYADDIGCKEAIMSYLLGKDPTDYKEEFVHQLLAENPTTRKSVMKIEPMNCKTCWYYQEHNGEVDCNPYTNDGKCLQNLFDR